MLVMTTAGTWGITGTAFLWGYGGLCAASAFGVWHAYRRALGPPADPADPLPRLGVGQIGLLNGGPDCAITAAAARLYYDGLVRARGGILVAEGRLDATADPIEREVFESVSREPWLSVDEMRTRVRESTGMRALTGQMTRAGLLLDEPQVRRARLLWIIPAVLTVLGVLMILAGLAAGQPVLALAVMTLIAAVATARLVALRPSATRRGRDMLERLRESHPLPSRPNARQIALGAAAFGAGILWLAESAIASALGVPREERGCVGSGGGAGGGAGCGAGGCCGGGCGCGG